MFKNLFGKKEQNSSDLLDKLAKVQEKADFVQIADLYYAIGEKYLKEGDNEKAFVYLNRFDNLVSSDDALYTKFEKKEEQVSDWIGTLEEEDLYINRIQNMIENLGADLDLSQKMRWHLLTLARFNKLFAKFNTIPGFEVMRQYENIIDILADSMFFILGEEETQNIVEWLGRFYTFSDSRAAADPRIHVPVTGRAPFEACDLSGNLLLTDMYMVFDDLIHHADGDEIEDMDIDFVKAGLLADYYVRTSDTEIQTLPQIQEEERRIRADYDFICQNPTHEEFLERVTMYKNTALLP